jgi:hypothetical protein
MAGARWLHHPGAHALTAVVAAGTRLSVLMPSGEGPTRPFLPWRHGKAGYSGGVLTAPRAGRRRLTSAVRAQEASAAAHRHPVCHSPAGEPRTFGATAGEGAVSSKASSSPLPDPESLASSSSDSLAAFLAAPLRLAGGVGGQGWAANGERDGVRCLWAVM